MKDNQRVSTYLITLIIQNQIWDKVSLIIDNTANQVLEITEII